MIKLYNQCQDSPINTTPKWLWDDFISLLASFEPTLHEVVHV